MEEKRSKMSNWEWVIIIIILAIIDILQAVLEWITVAISSVTINPIIDVLLTMLIPFYLYMRGEDMTDSKRIIGLFSTLLGELIPGVDEFPFWSAYGIYLFSLSRSSRILKKIPGGEAIATATKAK